MTFQVNLYTCESKSTKNLGKFTAKFHIIFSNKKGPSGYGIIGISTMQNIIQDTMNDINNDIDYQEFGLYRIKILSRIIQHYGKKRAKELGFENFDYGIRDDGKDLRIRSIVKRIENSHEFMLVPDVMLDATRFMIDDKFGKFGYKIYTFG